LKKGDISVKGKTADGTEKMKLQTVCTTLLFLAALWFACPSHARQYSDKIAAVVNGDVILFSDIEKHKRPIVRQLNRLPLGIVPPGKWPTEKEILDELIVMRLLEQEAKEKKIAVTDAQVDAAIDALTKRNRVSRDKFMMFLAANRVGPSEYRKLMKRQFILNRLITEEVTRKVPLREEDAQQYFKKNRDKINEEYDELVKSHTPARPPTREPKPHIPTYVTKHVGGRVRLKQITLPVPPRAGKKDAQRILAKAKQIQREVMTGADFGKLAKKYSVDSFAKSGGDIGMMRAKDLRPEYRKMVEILDVGEMSRPLPSRRGVVILYLAEAKGRVAKRVPLPEKVRKRLERQWREKYEEAKARSERNRRRTNSPRHPASPPRTAAKRNSKPVKDLGILSPEETKEYKEVREKVYAILRNRKTEARMKDWIQELKKNAIIEVKL
jgi:peptidyl-prolyl cis-trans isomerase SurA